MKQVLNLSGKIYEIDPNSKLYRDHKARKDQRYNFMKRVVEIDDVFNGTFAFYDGKAFGVLVGTEAEVKYGKDLVVTEKDGVRQFRKASAIYKQIAEIGKEVFEETINPFGIVDEFGPNNSYGNQWIGERWFYAAKRPEEVQEIESNEISAKDYLAIYQEALEESEAK